MLILKRNYFLIHNNNKYRCSIGKNGIKRFKKEGDFCTPMGKFSVGPIYYRKDRIKKMGGGFMGKRMGYKGGSKPDFLDLDKDGNTSEPMKQAAKQAKKK